jgi:hypothetical protein
MPRSASGAMAAGAVPAWFIAAETLTHRDGRGGELVAQSWNVQWAATTAMALRNVPLHFGRFMPICVESMRLQMRLRLQWDD